MKNMLGLLTAFGIASIGVVSASAATLEEASGSVRVNRGDGFVPASQGENLKAGDRVLVPAKSKVRLAYSDGCSVPVSGGNVATVAEVSPCSMSAQFNRPPGASTELPPPQFNPPGDSTGPMSFIASNPIAAGLGGAAAAAGIAAGAVAATSSNNNNNNNRQAALLLLLAQQRPATQ